MNINLKFFSKSPFAVSQWNQNDFDLILGQFEIVSQDKKIDFDFEQSETYFQIDDDGFLEIDIVYTSIHFQQLYDLYYKKQGIHSIEQLTDKLHQIIKNKNYSLTCNISQIQYHNELIPYYFDFGIVYFENDEEHDIQQLTIEIIE